VAKQAPNEPKTEPPAATAGGERLCSVCGTRLSGYNPGPNCWQHTVGYPWRGPTAKPKV
jgi:hypothetical protein